MAKEEKPDIQSPEDEPSQEESKAPAKKALWRRLLPRKWTVLVLAVSIANFGIGFICSQLFSANSAAKVSAEVDLGEFSFRAEKDTAGSIVKAEFKLHVDLLDMIDQTARSQLKAREFRVQQDIEELLRQAHGGDFEDPTLGGLKRQLQEQVNETLGMRAIADVIITDLKVAHGGGEAQAVAETSESVPWVEEPAEKPSKLAATGKN